ncbi:arabinofuranosidase catalytic domain-containing protein [Ancylobacter sp. TS-1]|uniref:arabinofuranosidase catalytic domain-containing protein n=1 Tax=Ancylobacter sp. TS-1 TaxID=1850374 RepID=UPI001265C476|nr:arabinofuranosidase catalytic domain-containing protein [Ancylobacter sp. TS-1]QFR31731.1 hypothetical protein GBB76_00610 [Ancylobacter sp. TS-1]
MAASLGMSLDLARRRPAGTPAPLDGFAGQIYAAFGLERLFSAYAGPCLRVRRSTDDAQADIGFAGRRLDMAALLAFVGAGSGHVVAWYDQSGNGRHAEQAGAAYQPRLVNAGVPGTGPGGRPAMTFDGSDDFLEIAASLGFSRAQPAVAMGAVALRDLAGTRMIGFAAVGGGVVSRAQLSVGTAVVPGGRRLNTDAYADVLGPAIASGAWRRIIGRWRPVTAQIDAAVDGAVITGAWHGPGPFADTDQNLPVRVGSGLGSSFHSGGLAAFVLAQGAPDIATLDRALARLLP